MRPDEGSHLVDLLLLQHAAHHGDDVLAGAGHGGQVGVDAYLSVLLGVGEGVEEGAALPELRGRLYIRGNMNDN